MFGPKRTLGSIRCYMAIYLTSDFPVVGPFPFLPLPQHFYTKCLELSYPGTYENINIGRLHVAYNRITFMVNIKPTYLSTVERVNFVISV